MTPSHIQPPISSLTLHTGGIIKATAVPFTGSTKNIIGKTTDNTLSELITTFSDSSRAYARN